MRNRPTPWTMLLFFLLLGAGIRGLFLITPFMDSDQAINGLMARHVLQGEFPFFFYGQDYCGSLEAYLVSAVFFLFGVSRLTLNTAIGLFSLGLILFMYFFTQRISDRRTALRAALFAALPSYYLVFHSVLARSAYIEIPVIGVLLFLFCHKVLSEDPPGKCPFFLLGFFAGLGIWTHFLIVFSLPPLFFLLLIKYRRFWRQPSLLFLLLGVVMGGLPLWTHNLLNPLVTWHYLMETSGGGDPVVASLGSFFRFRLPEVLGLVNNETGTFILPYAAPFIYCLYLAAFGYWGVLEGRKIWKRRKEEGWSSGQGLLVLFFFLFPCIFALSGFASGHTSRYLMPIFAALPVVFAQIIRGLGSFSTVLSSLFLVVHLFFNLWGTLERSPLCNEAQSSRYIQARENDRRLLDTLKANQLRRIYCVDYWTSVRLTFDAGEEVLIAAPYGDRYSKYTRLIDQSPQAAFLFPGDNGDFEATLKAIGGSYRKNQWFGYSVYHDFRPPPYDFIEVFPRCPAESVGSMGRDQEKVFDRDLNTRWSTGVPQRPGTSFLVDLGRTVPDLSRVTLYAGATEDLPRGIRLEISKDGRAWETVREIPAYFGSLFWSGPHPFHRPLDRVDLIFPPRSGRYLRMTQLGTDRVYYWSVAECFIYQSRPRSSPPDPGVKAVLAHWGKSIPVRIYADPWLAAYYGQERGGVISKEDATNLPEARIWLPTTPVLTTAVEKAYSSPMVHFLSDRLRLNLPAREVAGYRIFSISSSNSEGLSRARGLWQASANVNSGRARMALDGRITTRWTTDRPQRPGDYFQIDLGKMETVSGLRCLVGGSQNDFPRGLTLRYSVDGKQWSSLEGRTWPVGLRWTGETLLLGGGDMELHFPPVSLRYLRLIQTGEDPVFYWSIHELELFQGRQ